MAKSKSAYSVPGKQGKLDTHIIVVWVDNEAGVLARVAGLFSSRGYSIESLAVAEVDPKLMNCIFYIFFLLYFFFVHWIPPLRVPTL